MSQAEQTNTKAYQQASALLQRCLPPAGFVASAVDALPHQKSALL